jgi:iron(III) transport system permease protein
MLNDVAALSVLMGVLAIGIVTLQGYMQRRHALPYRDGRAGAQFSVR